MEDIKGIVLELLSANLGKIGKIQTAWREIGWKEFLENTFPYKATSKTIYVAVTHPIWKNEILHNSERILKKINRLTGENFTKFIVDVNLQFFLRRRKQENRKKIREAITVEDVKKLILETESEEMRSRLMSLMRKIEKRGKNDQY